MHATRHLWIGGLAAAAVGLASLPAIAQSRSSVTPNRVGSLSVVGAGSSYGFRTSSAGLGALGRSRSTGADQGVLRSLGNAGAYRIRPGGGGGGGINIPGAMLSGSPTQSRRLYSPTEFSTARLDLSHRVSALSPDKIAVSDAYTYLSAVGGAADPDAPSEPITSLTPDLPQAEREHNAYYLAMERGEAALRRGQFVQAKQEFLIANTITGEDPESFLSLFHAQMALSRNSYHASAGYLAAALRLFPELPTLPLQPKSFFGANAAYLDVKTGLVDTLNKDRDDPEANFAIAYFHWFEGSSQAARNALANAAASTDLPVLREAIDVFWDGMKATGKVQGSLRTESLPNTQPDQQAPPPPAPAL